MATMWWREIETIDEPPISKWFVGAVIANDILTILTFLWLGLAGQLPMNFAVALAVSLAIPIVLIWTSPSPIPVGVGCFLGMMFGLLVGDALLGIPFHGPVPDRPNLMFHRMLGPLFGCALGMPMQAESLGNSIT